MKTRKLLAFMLAIVMMISQIAIPVSAENTSYRVVLHLCLNGGSYDGSTADKEFQPYAFSEVTLMDPTRDGYTFLGWQRVSEDGRLYSDVFTGKYSVTEKPKQVLCARWEEETITN